MKIIIPMAGQSRRFTEAGYTHPKPFIYIDGKPMIEHVCAMFNPKDEFILVCNKAHLENSNYRQILEQLDVPKTIIPIDAHEQGPVWTVLQAKNHIAADDPFIISYCDFYLDWNYTRFKAVCSQHDGVISAFKGFHPASFGDTLYCYLKINTKNELIELREKQCYTDNRSEEYASTGVYYFNHWHMYQKYAQHILDNKIKTANEFYASLLFNPMVQDGLSIGIDPVDKFICWGTPEDLAEYTSWSNYFTYLANKAAFQS